VTPHRHRHLPGPGLCIIYHEWENKEVSRGRCETDLPAFEKIRISDDRVFISLDHDDENLNKNLQFVSDLKKLKIFFATNFC
jgi:hypothetical protein